MGLYPDVVACRSDYVYKTLGYMGRGIQEKSVSAIIESSKRASVDRDISGLDIPSLYHSKSAFDAHIYSGWFGMYCGHGIYCSI
jgi:hypothetical protein